MPIAFAIANDCQKAGREYFHRICRISPKYNKVDADKIYDGALKKNDWRNCLDTVFHLAKRAGTDLDTVYQCIIEEEEEESTQTHNACRPFLLFICLSTV